MLDAIARDNPKLSQNSLKHIKHFLTGIFTFAVQRGLRDANPMRDVAIPKGASSKGTHAYAPDEIVSMMEVLPEPARTVVAAAAFTGLRRSELRGLQWGDIDGNQSMFAEPYGTRLSKTGQRPRRAAHRYRSFPCSRSGWRLTKMAGQKTISFSGERGEGAHSI